MKKIMVGLLAIGLLAGCSTETAKETKTPVTKPEKVEAPKVNQADIDRKEMIAYSTEIMPAINDATNVMNMITNLAQIGSANPASMTSATYIKAAHDIGDAAQSVADKINSIDPGTNEKVLKVHGYMLDAAEEFQFIADNYPSSIENMDADMIGELAIRAGNIGTDMQQATSVVQEVQTAQ